MLDNDTNTLQSPKSRDAILEIENPVGIFLKKITITNLVETNEISYDGKQKIIINKIIVQAGWEHVEVVGMYQPYLPKNRETKILG